VAPSARAATIQPLSAERYRVQLCASADLKRKLELARDLLRHAVPSGDLALLVERALDVLIEQTLKRRFGMKTPGKSPAVSSPASAQGDRDVANDAPPPQKHTRHIPNRVRRTAIARDGIRCTYEAPDGTRCTARAWLEHDHATPWARGGSNDASNIRPRCRAHNRLAAEQAFGRDTIARIIERHRAPPRASGEQPQDDSPALRRARGCP
jgi:hypothetical protein